MDSRAASLTLPIPLRGKCFFFGFRHEFEVEFLSQKEKTTWGGCDPKYQKKTLPASSK